MQAIPNAGICIAEIARLLDGHSWMAGEALSLADLLLAPHLSMLALAPEGAAILREHENLRGWLARIEARPSMQETTWDRLLERAAAAAGVGGPGSIADWLQGPSRSVRIERRGLCMLRFAFARVRGHSLRSTI